jgi:hypothetical protein
MSSSPKEFTSQSMTPEALPPHPLSSWLSKKEKSGPNSDHVCACASGLCQRKGSDGHLMVWEEDLFLNTLKNSKDESLRTWCALPAFFKKMPVLLPHGLGGVVHGGPLFAVFNSAKLAA